MAYEGGNVIDLSVPVSADLSTHQYKVVDIDSSGQAGLFDGANPALGILQDAPAASGRAGNVRQGGVSKAQVTGAIVIGDRLAPNASGLLVPADTVKAPAIATARQANASGTGVLAVLVEREPATIPVKVLKFQYDFADLGGATGALTLTDENNNALTLPDNACIARAYVESLTTGASSGSATIKLGFTGDDDAFIAATAMNHATYTAEGVTELTAGIPVKTSAEVSVLATVATAALTAGKFNVYVEYVVGD